MKILKSVSLFKKQTLNELLGVSKILDVDFLLSTLKIRPVTLKIHPQYMEVEDRELAIEEGTFSFVDILSSSKTVDMDSAILAEFRNLGDDGLEEFSDPVNTYFLTCSYTFNHLCFNLVPDVLSNKNKLIHDFDFSLDVEFEVELAKPELTVNRMLGLDGKTIGVKFQTDFLIPDADYNHWLFSTNEVDDVFGNNHTNDLRMYESDIKKRFTPGTAYRLNVSYEDRHGKRVCDDIEPLRFMFDDNYKFILLGGSNESK